MQLNWDEARDIAIRFKTSLSPPHNPWFLDLPIEWVPSLLTMIEQSIIEPFGITKGSTVESEKTLNAMPLPESRQLRIVGGVKGWDAKVMDILQPELLPDFDSQPIPGFSVKLETPIFADEMPEGWAYIQHGFAKASAMILGLGHHHDGDDLVITTGWPAMLEGFGFSSEGESPLRIKDAKSHFSQRISQLRDAHTVLVSERARQKKLAQEKAVVRIAAETDARQRGLGIAETDNVGIAASDKVIDNGPDDPKGYLASQIHEDDHAVDGILIEIRKISDLRWEHSAPVRIGCRMGRPEKAAPRVMNPRTHTLFPIELNGGNQRLLANAMEKDTISVQMGKRVCTKCEKISPMVICHHRILNQEGKEEAGLTCGGRTLMKPADGKKKRRRGELQNVNLTTLIEDARVKLGLDRIPRQIKCMKKIASRDQTPEAIEKGILRAKYDLPVFRDGTIRYDMSDVPITHFTPREIEVPWKTLKELGYNHDCHGKELSKMMNKCSKYSHKISSSAKTPVISSSVLLNLLTNSWFVIMEWNRITM